MLILAVPMYIVYNHQQISSAFCPLNWGLDRKYCIIQVKSVLDISVVFKMTVLLTYLVYCICTATWIVKMRDNFADGFARACETGTLCRYHEDPINTMVIVAIECTV